MGGKQFQITFLKKMTMKNCKQFFAIKLSNQRKCPFPHVITRSLLPSSAFVERLWSWNVLPTIEHFLCRKKWSNSFHPILVVLFLYTHARHVCWTNKNNNSTIRWQNMRHKALQDLINRSMSAILSSNQNFPIFKTTAVNQHTSYNILQTNHHISTEKNFEWNSQREWFQCKTSWG